MRELKPIKPVPPMRRDMDIVANRLPSTPALAGQTIELEYEGGATLTMAFTATRVQWSVPSGSGMGHGGEGSYDAVEIRPNVFFVDFSLPDGSMAVSHVVDRPRGRALSVWSEITDAGGKPDLRERLMPARLVGHAGPYESVTETRELLGKRLFCEYSSAAALEHIYVNSATIVWQWLRSPPELAREVGIEAATMWKIQDRLYLISTRGEDPIQLTLLLDLQRMRNVGRLFGRGHFGLVDRRCGAKITFLGEFAYPESYRPG
jgi:hypothetical protein